jgi:exodeoxyribonuclease VII small subunit
MEGGKLSLDDMIARFEEGQKLLKFCGQKLNEVERRIEKLVRKGDELVTEPLDENVEESGEASSGREGKDGELF